MKKKAKAISQARVRANNSRNVARPSGRPTVADIRENVARRLLAEKPGRRLSQSDVEKALIKRK